MISNFKKQYIFFIIIFAIVIGVFSYFFVKNIHNEGNKGLVHIDKQLNQIKQTLTQVGLTGEELQKELAKQKAALQVISQLTGDAKTKYILETKILPDLIKAGKIPEKCKTTNINNLVTCLYVTKISIDELLKQLPENTRNYVKKVYYYKVYSLDKKNLLKQTNDPTAIEQKKRVVYQLFYDGVITNPKICQKFPEKEVRKYCLSLFRP